MSLAHALDTRPPLWWTDQKIDAARKETAALLEKLCASDASAAVGGAAFAAPKLAEVTLDDRDHALLPGPEGGTDTWNIRVDQFSSGCVEIRATLGSMLMYERARFLKPTDKAGDTVKEKPRFESSVARSKRTLRARALELDGDHMMTLTKRGKFLSCDDLWSVFAKFSRLMAKRFEDRWKYVAVPELHSDGETWHMHVILNGFYWAGTVRRLWFKALGGNGNETGEHTPGGVNLKFFKGGASVARTRRIAGYVAKYVGKGFTASNRGRRLFGASSGLLPHRVSRWHVRHWVGISELAVSLQQWVHQLGGSAKGAAYFWSRSRLDGRPLMLGFIISTEMRV